MTLTPPQAAAAERILNAYAAYMAEHRFPPSRRELAMATHYSMGALTRHVQRMEAAGLISIERRRARGIRVLVEREA